MEEYLFGKIRKIYANIKESYAPLKENIYIV
jgi:hypothetical protein